MTVRTASTVQLCASVPTITSHWSDVRVNENCRLSSHLHVVIQIVLEEVLEVIWHGRTFGGKPTARFEPYIYSLMVQNDVKPKYKLVQIFLFAECLKRSKSLALCQFGKVL